MKESDNKFLTVSDPEDHYAFEDAEEQLSIRPLNLAYILKQALTILKDEPSFKEWKGLKADIKGDKIVLTGPGVDEDVNWLKYDLFISVTNQSGQDILSVDPISDEVELSFGFDLFFKDLGVNPSEPSSYPELKNTVVVMTGKPPKGYTKDKVGQILKFKFGVSAIEPAFTKRTTVVIYNPAQLNTAKLKKAQVAGLVCIPYEDLGL